MTSSTGNKSIENGIGIEGNNTDIGFSDNEMPEISVFRAGKHTDMNGNTREFSVEDLREIAQNYNKNANDPAPVVIGHPKDNSPAWGWIGKARESGGELLLKLKQVAPEFKQFLADGRYKKVSVSLYPPEGDRGWRLRHLGYLGAMPPAVKGLPIPQYSEAETYISFNTDISTEVEELTESPSENPIDKPIIENVPITKEEIMSTIPVITPPVTSPPDNSFAERESQLAAREAALKARELQFKRDRIDNFCESLIAAGKMLPVHKTDQINFMMSLDENTSIDFAEGKKESSLVYYQGFLKSQPQVVHFGEVAGVDSAPPQQENEVDKAYKKSATEYAEAWKETVNIGGNK